MKGIPFWFPEIMPQGYAVGYQPFITAGEPQTPGWPGAVMHAIPWPRVVDTISSLASDPGMARMRAIIPVVNQYGPFPANYLFLSGVVGKSQG